MQVTETGSEGLKREFTIVVEASEIEAKVDARIAELAKTANMQGFRPGKVPQSLLRQRYGDSVMGEVLEEAVNNGTTQALTDNDLRPALQPKVDVKEFDKGKDLEYTVEVEILPTIEPTDFSKIKLERMKAEPAKSEVEDAIKRLADAQKTFEADPKRKSENGDAVVIDFVGSVDGVEFEGGKGDDYNLELGSNSFIPGFEEQLVGKKTGDHVQVKVDFPADYGSDELDGKAAVFEVDVKEVKVASAAEVNDALAERVGLENLEALTTAISEQMSGDYDGMARQRLKRELLDVLAEGNDFDVPEGMIEQEFQGIWQQVEQQRAQDGDNADAEDADKTDDELKEEYREIAIRRVRLGLLLSDVGTTNNIEVQQDEVNRAMAEQARQFPGQEQMLVEYYQKNPDAMNSLRAPIYEDKVVDFILELASVSEKKVSVEELTAEPEAKEEKPKKKAAAKKKAAPKKKAAAKADDAD
jgi:trigger factor